MEPTSTSHKRAERSTAAGWGPPPSGGGPPGYAPPGGAPPQGGGGYGGAPPGGYGGAPPGGYGPPGGYVPGGYVPPGCYVPGGYGTNGGPKTSGLAITSLVTGCVAMPLMLVQCCCAFLPLSSPLGLTAVITGGLAIAQVNKNPHALKGRGLAIAGLILGCISILMSIVGLVSTLDDALRERYSGGW